MKTLQIGLQGGSWEEQAPQLSRLRVKVTRGGEEEAAE